MHAGCDSSQPRKHRGKLLAIYHQAALDDEAEESRHDICAELSTKPVAGCRPAAGTRLLFRGKNTRQRLPFRGKHTPQRPLPEVFSTGALPRWKWHIEQACQDHPASHGKLRKGPRRVDRERGFARASPPPVPHHMPELLVGEEPQSSCLKDPAWHNDFRHLLMGEQGDSGEPQGTPLLADTIKGYKSPLDFICFLHGCLEAFLAHIPAEHGTDAPAAPFQGATLRPFWEEVFAATERARASSQTFDQLAEQCRHFVEEARARGFVRILLSFDEATSLCEPAGAALPFQALLDAISIVPSGLFAMLLDTKGRAHGFPPGGLENMIVGTKGAEGYSAPPYPFILAVNVKVFEIFEEPTGAAHCCGPWRICSRRGGLLSSFLEIVYASWPLFGPFFGKPLPWRRGTLKLWSCGRGS